MATYTVGNTDDTPFADCGTTSSGVTGGAGSLSDALEQADATGEPVTIDIMSDVELSGPLSPISNPNVTINGNGHTICAGGNTGSTWRGSSASPGMTTIRSASRSNSGDVIADVLRNAHNVQGRVVITDLTSGDAVRLAGVTRAQLVHNRGDIAFHP